MGLKNKYTCLIIDDETLARQLLRTHLTQFNELEIAGEFTSASEAVKYLKTNNVDLIFLDVQMPKLSGIDFLKLIENPPKVILTTAFSEFAIEGYELNVVDYLLKPITFERFNKAADRALEILNLEMEAKESSSLQMEEKTILIKSKHQLIKIEISDILFIEGLHKYIKIITKEKTYITLFGISAMENELHSKLFFRCHRSFIVNLSMIDRIEGYLAFIGHREIPISKSNKSELISKLGKQIG